MNVATAKIDYPEMIDKAMRGVVRSVLSSVVSNGLPDGHSLYLSFATTHPGVRLSPQLRDSFEPVVTIVLQHQFWDLKVERDYFSVMLSFNNIPELLVIPFASLTAFADPSVKFGLQFHASADDGMDADELEDYPLDLDGMASFEEGAKDANDADGASGETKVISIDAFRKR